MYITKTEYDATVALMVNFLKFKVTYNHKHSDKLSYKLLISRKFFLPRTGIGR